MTLLDPNAIAFHGMSIHMLHSSKHKLCDQKSTEVFISFIVNRYNNNKKSHDGEIYKSQPIRNWEPKNNSKFYRRVYYSQRMIRTGFLQWLNAENTAGDSSFHSSVIHSVCFLYRMVKENNTNQKVQQQWELFALTTEDGWRMVKPFADFKFPNQIVARLVYCKISSSESKSLAGHRDSSTETYREEYSLKEHEIDSIWRIFKTIHSHFKLGSSLYNPEYKLSAFDNPKNKRSIEMGVGKIIIGGNLTFPQHEEILEHFSRIANGEKTYCIRNKKKEEEEDDSSWRYLENIQPVEQELVAKLENALLVLVWHYYKNQALDGQLTFVHRYFKDFYHSCEFTLKYAGEEVNWNYRPSLKEIMENLRRLYGSSCNSADFACRFNQTRMKYNRKNTLYSLREFFHGELRHNHKTYFYVDGMWLQVKAGHLAVLQRSFYELLKGHLVEPSSTCALTKPWFANKEWIMFSLENIEEATKMDTEVVKNALQALEKQTFSFIDSRDKVQCPYPTRCLIENHSYGAKFTKTIQKNWEALKIILNEKQGQKVTEKDLEALFKKEKQKYAQQLMALLKNSYPVLVKEPLGRVKKAAILRQDGTPSITDLSAINFNQQTIKDNRPQLQELLSQKKESGEPLTQEDIVSVLPKKSKRHAKAVYQAFQKPTSPKKDSLYGSRYIVQGPISNNEEMNQQVWEFLRQQHDNYRHVLEEEGYNRLFLNEENFLVCDQVYAGKKERVELFDIMRWNSEELFLYHVKETFGQKTGEACKQIRNSAALIKSALDVGDYAILRRLYDQTTSEATSPFRQSLKQKLEALPEGPNDTKPSDRLVNLFRKERGKIIFVYAFIDDSKKERLLKDEQNPQYEFNPADFSTCVAGEDVEKVVTLLKKKGYLDRYNRLHDSFLILTKEQFQEEMKDVGESDKVYKLLYSKASQFDSLVAKVELLHTWNFLQERGFGFKICQIPRSPSYNDLTESPPIVDLGAEWETIPDVPVKAFIYEKQTYYLSDKSYTAEKAIGILFRLDPDKYNSKEVRLKIASLFSDHWGSEQLKRYLQHLKENSNNQTTFKAIFSEKSKKLTPLEIDEIKEGFLLCFIHPNFSIGRLELETVSSCLNVKLVLLPQNSAGKVITDKPKIFNPNGRSTRIFTLQGSSYSSAEFQAEERGKSFIEREVIDDRLLYSNYLDEQQQVDLIFGPCHTIGLVNQGLDCFFNAFFQLIFHSPLLRFFLNPDNLMLNSDGRDKEFQSFLTELALDYSLNSQASSNESDRLFSATYSSEDMRNFFDFAKNSQEDPGEVITKMSRYYDLSPIQSQFKRIRTVNLSEKVLTNKMADENEFTVVGENGKCEIDSSDYNLILLPDPHAKTFQELINAMFTQKAVNAEWSFIHKDEVFKVETWKEQLEVVDLKEVLFFVINRFSKRPDKDLSPIPTDQLKDIEIAGFNYSLNGFIEHKGSTLDGGHYISYCLTENGWMQFDDAKKPTEFHENTVIARAANAYILCYKKQEEK